MIINFEIGTKTLWHSDCEDAKYSPPMKVISHTAGQTLMECTFCKKTRPLPERW